MTEHDLASPAAAPTSDLPSALRGVRVIDAATLAAGPLVATMMAEFGADVIKVEQPVVGDPMRDWGARKNDVGLVWKSIARNKRCITLNLRMTAGQLLFHQLAATADVVIVNARASALRRWNICWDDLHAVNDQLVMLHVSGYGAGGPKSDQPGFGTLAEAMSGFAHLTGEPDGPPTLPSFMLADGVASQSATWAVMMALYAREVHGAGGQLVDVSLLEPLSRLIEMAALTYDQTGTIPGRVGNRWDASVPRNAYPTADGRWIAVSSAAPAIIRRIYQAIDRPGLAEDPDYVDPVLRVARADEIDTMVADWISARTLAEAMAVFEAAEVTAAPIYDARQLIEDPHFTARGMYVSLPDDDLGQLRVQGPVVRMSGTPGRVEHLGPAVGAHNDEVYPALLGLSPARLAELRTDGVI